MDVDDTQARLARGEDVTFPTSRAKTVGIWAGSAVLAAASVWMIAAGEQVVVGWVGAVFFGLGVVVLGVQVVSPPAAMVLTPDAIRLPNGLGRDTVVAWDQVASAYVGTIPVARNVTAGVVELRPGEHPRLGSPDGDEARGRDAARSYRRPDGAAPGGRIVVIQARFRGGTLREAVALLDELARRRRRAG